MEQGAEDFGLFPRLISLNCCAVLYEGHYYYGAVPVLNNLFSPFKALLYLPVISSWAQFIYPLSLAALVLPSGETYLRLNRSLLQPMSRERTLWSHSQTHMQEILHVLL